MVVTNEFERNLNDQTQLKRPGRVDMVVFQNIPDAGDGNPGIQRCFRNYLHEGGFEKDLDLLGYSIKGTSVDINNAELQQLSNIGSSIITSSIWTQLNNIGAVTINGTQWGYVGGADQPVKVADSPTFGGLALTGNLTLAGNSITGSSFDINNVELQQLGNIGSNTINGTQWGYLGNSNQNVRTSDSPIFVGLTLSANLITSSTIDGIDVANHDHSGGSNGVAVPFTSLSGDIIYTQLDSIVDISGVGSSSLISRANHVHTAADGSSKISHDDLTSASVSANDHHNQSHTLASHSTKAHGELSDAPTSAHHVKTVNTWAPWGTTGGTSCEGNDGRLSNARTPTSHGYGSHSDIDQELKTNSSVTFSNLTMGNLQLAIAAGKVYSTVGLILGSPSYIKFEPEGTSYHYRMDVYSDDVQMYQYDATSSNEKGNIGQDDDDVQPVKPLKSLNAKYLASDTGGVGTYSHVDDLQLLREAKEWDVREKAIHPGFPDFKQKVFDFKTLPWVKAVPPIAALPDDDNDRRYQIPMNSQIGYLLSTLQVMLKRQDELVNGNLARDLIIDDLISRINILEGN